MAHVCRLDGTVARPASTSIYIVLLHSRNKLRHHIMASIYSSALGRTDVEEMNKTHKYLIIRTNAIPDHGTDVV